MYTFAACCKTVSEFHFTPHQLDEVRLGAVAVATAVAAATPSFVLWCRLHRLQWPIKLWKLDSIAAALSTGVPRVVHRPVEPRLELVIIFQFLLRKTIARRKQFLSHRLVKLFSICVE